MKNAQNYLQHYHDALHQQWVRQCQTHPEFGGKNFKRTIKIARQAVWDLGGVKLQRVLDQTGLGSHPEIVRAFWKAGCLMSSNRPSTSAPRQKTIAELFYPGFNDPS